MDLWTYFRLHAYLLERRVKGLIANWILRTFPNFRLKFNSERMVVFCCACQHLEIVLPTIWDTHKLKDCMNNEIIPTELKVKSRHLWRFMLFRRFGVGLFDEETTHVCIDVFNRARSGLEVLNPGKDITFDLVATQFYRFSRV